MNIVKLNQRRITTKSLFLLILGFLLFSNVFAQDQIISLPNGEKVVLHADKTWDSVNLSNNDFDYSKLKDNQIPEFLRKGINVDRETLIEAVKIYLQGWRYTMPQPKSAQAAWGNYDGRTTWWKGYWYNNKTNKYSRIKPHKQSNGYYYGDEQNEKDYWSNGGSPGNPSKIDWLLSSEGGVKPQ